MSEYQYYEWQTLLRATAERLRQGEERRQQAEAEAKRIKDLQDFAPRAPQAWRDIAALIEEKKARHRLAEFEARLSSLQTQYAGRPAFQERLRKAGLV